MSEEATQIIAKLRSTYARQFNVPERDLTQWTYPNGETEIWHKNLGHLPTWSTGKLSNP